MVALRNSGHALPSYVEGVARKLRIEFPGALYHVINRGNYRRDVFDSVGAAQAFERAVDETCRRFSWRLHAYVVMRNHFHFALETPQPNLSAGMHWLQSTYAIRFNRFREEHGHLFQGRYHAIILEDAAVLTRVVHYIHLNPARAGIVEPAACGTFRWSSLRYLRQPVRPPWMATEVILSALSLPDTLDGWKQYDQFLEILGSDPQQQEQLGFEQLSRGWAIGTREWKRQLASERDWLRLPIGLSEQERQELQEASWQEFLSRSLATQHRTLAEAGTTAKDAPWKVIVAAELRDRGVPYRWITDMLRMSTPRVVGSLVFRLREHRRV